MNESTGAVVGAIVALCLLLALLVLAWSQPGCLFGLACFALTWRTWRRRPWAK